MKKIAIILFGLICLGSSQGYAFQFWGSGNTSINTAQFPPVSQVTVSTSVPINPTASYMQVVSTGGPVTFSALGSWPAISTASAQSGQFLTLASTTTSNVVYISTGVGSAVAGTNSSIVISSSISAVQFMYNAGTSQWQEVGKQQ